MIKIGPHSHSRYAVQLACDELGVKPLPIVTVVKTVVGHYVSLRFSSCFVTGDTVTEDLHVGYADFDQVGDCYVDCLNDDCGVMC